MLKFKDLFPKLNELKRNLSFLYLSEKKVIRMKIVLKFTLITGEKTVLSFHNIFQKVQNGKSMTVLAFGQCYIED